MEINDTGELLTGTIIGLIEAAFEDETLLVLQFDISSLYFDGLSFEDFGTWVRS